MKFFTGCVAAALLALAATAAQGQILANGAARGAYVAVSDFDGPYGPPEAAPLPPPRYGYGYDDGRAPAPVAALPATEVYAVLRDNGFSPLGIPRLRGAVYTIAVIDRRGDDGRLVIDARDGRILRFVPAADAFGMAPAHEERAVTPYGPQSALPPPTMVRSGPPRPPAPIPHVASRTVPLPKAAPPRGERPMAATKPASPEPAPQQAQAPQAQPVQQTAAAQPKTAESAPQAAAPTVGQAKPAATILPTQDMPAAQGLD
ncbi:pyruvate/2-oxoglutarate dehydrogenase complex dihydrolipoamide acyltransferase (E2) component [Bradyrhizobium sp. LM2.7]